MFIVKSKKAILKLGVFRMNNKWLTKKERYTLVKLNSNFTNIDKIKKEILTKDYKEHLSYIEFDPNNSKSYFEYKWVDIENKRQQELNSGITIDYVKATADYEYSRKRRNDSEGNLLPKDQRVNTNDVEVIFAEYNSEVYGIIFSNDDMELQRVRKLIGESNVTFLDDKFKVTPKFFGWLFYEHMKDKIIDDNKKIINIKGFSGNIVNDTNKFTGKSKSASNLLLTKTILANNYPLTSIDLELNTGLESDKVYTCAYIYQSTDDELRIIVQRVSETNLLFVSDDLVNVMPFYMFFDLIPNMHNAYLDDEDNYENNEKPSFLKQLGIEEIKQTMQRNHISVDDLK